jgi:thiol-disulfide isomerase/thioredoxin
MRRTLLALSLAAACASSAVAQQRSQPPPVFPDLEFTGWEGGSVRLSDLKGNVVLLNVWATWCGPCKLELPTIQKLYDIYSDRNFVVIALNVDADRNRVAPFMKKLNISVPVYYAALEDAAVVNQMTAMGIPSTFLLGPDRTILDHQVGYAPQYEERWKQVVEKYLKAKK